MAPSPAGASALGNVTLDDKYELESGRVYLTGVQALVRLLMLQRQRDKLAGLTTAGFVSAYRGSRLGHEPVLGPVGRLQVRVGYGRKLRIDQYRSGSGEDGHARRFPVPAGRHLDSLARRLPRNRSADAGLQDLRRAALLPRQQAQS